MGCEPQHHMENNGKHGKHVASFVFSLNSRCTWPKPISDVRNTPENTDSVFLAVQLTLKLSTTNSTPSSQHPSIAAFVVPRYWLLNPLWFAHHASWKVAIELSTQRVSTCRHCRKIDPEDMSISYALTTSNSPLSMTFCLITQIPRARRIPPLCKD